MCTSCCAIWVIAQMSFPIFRSLVLFFFVSCLVVCWCADRCRIKVLVLQYSCVPVARCKRVQYVCKLIDINNHYRNFTMTIAFTFLLIVTRNRIELNLRLAFASSTVDVLSICMHVLILTWVTCSTTCSIWIHSRLIFKFVESFDYPPRTKYLLPSNFFLRTNVSTLCNVVYYLVCIYTWMNVFTHEKIISTI